MSQLQGDKKSPTPEEPPLDEKVQTIWGIKAKDQLWFHLITITAGTAGAVAVTVATVIEALAGKLGVRTILIETFTGVAAAYAMSGFAAWAILNTKEAIVSIAEHIRDKTRKNRMITKEEGRQEGLREGRREGREQTINNLLAKAEASGDQRLKDLLETERENRQSDSNE